MGYLRHNQVEEIENQKSVIERTLQGREVQDRGNLNAHLQRIDRQLKDQAPPDLTGEQRDEKVRECREIEERLIPLMPSDEQMRRNPPGVVGQHRRYDKASKSKAHFPEGDIFRWKDNQLALHKGDDDPDVANFERMRPLHNHGSMEGAQIPGKQYHGTNPSQAYLDGHIRTFGPGGESMVDPPVDETVVDPPKRIPVTRKKISAKSKKISAKKNGSVKMTALACGRMMGPHGRHFHINKCETCQEAAKE